MTFFRHPQALVETEEIGDGTRVWAFAHVMSGARVGRNCNIGEHCFIERGAVLADNVTVKNQVSIWAGVTVDEGAFIGPGASLTNDLRPRSRQADWTLRETRIGRVIYGLRSPFMGGHSRWNIMADKGLSDAMPEVFAVPPTIVAGFMAEESAGVFAAWNPMIWQFIASRGLFVTSPAAGGKASGGGRRDGLWLRLVNAFRRIVIDRIGGR